MLNEAFGYCGFGYWVLFGDCILLYRNFKKVMAIQQL